MAREVSSKSALATFLGVLALLFWGTTIAFTRRLSEEVGVLTAMGATSLISGLLACVLFVRTPNRMRQVFQLRPAYLFGCGFFFVAYVVCLCLAVGRASGRAQVIEVGIINYLWPGLTLALSVPILKKKARLFLWPGMLVAFAGIAVVMSQGGGMSWAGFKQRFVADRSPYLLALGAGLTWPLFSNLSRKWAGGTKLGAMPLFILASGIVLCLLRLIFPEQSNWSRRAVLQIAYMAVFPTLLANVFWDIAMRRGNVILTGTLSYFTPLLSTLISMAILQVRVGPKVWVACGMVVAGAIVCKLSIAEPGDRPDAGYRCPSD